MMTMVSVDVDSGNVSVNIFSTFYPYLADRNGLVGCMSAVADRSRTPASRPPSLHNTPSRHAPSINDPLTQSGVLLVFLVHGPACATSAYS